MGYAEGYATGASTGGSVNPFQGILKAIGESQARRYAEDKKRRDEEATLSDALLTLGKDYEYKTELERQKALFRGDIAETEETGEGTFEQRGMLGRKRYKQTPQTQPITDDEGNIIGYRPKGAVFGKTSEIDKLLKLFGGGQETPTFSSEEEAIKAGLPKGTIVSINGKKARID